MSAGSDTNHLYTDLAWLWPMWGDHAIEYARYCEHVVRLIGRYARNPVKTLIDISCGCGKNVFNLKKRFQVTGLDLSPAMIDLARKLNPECEFIQGDMRRFSLARTFDAILMDDGISYMTTAPDLTATISSALDHLEPGGVMVVTVDMSTETFCQNITSVTHGLKREDQEDVDVVFVENIYDPDPSDTRYETTIVYLIREKGRLRIETDRFTLGLFSLDTWERILSETGFIVHREEYADDGSEFVSFACVKP